MTVTSDGPATYALARYVNAVYAEPVSVGENVKRLRVAAGLSTQALLAERMGVPQPRVSDLENDRYELPDTKTLMIAAAAIGCTVDALLSGIDADYDRQKGATASRAVDARSPALKRAIRLLALMSPAGQQLAVKNIALLVPAFPRDAPPESPEQSGGTREETVRTRRGKR